MGCKVIFSPQAIADLAAMVHIIAKDNPEAAVRMGNALIARVAILESFPLIGSVYPKRPGVRKLVSRPYLVSIAFAKRRKSWTFCVTGTVRGVNQIRVRSIDCWRQWRIRLLYRRKMRSFSPFCGSRFTLACGGGNRQVS